MTCHSRISSKIKSLVFTYSNRGNDGAGFDYWNAKKSLIVPPSLWSDDIDEKA